ncbi:MAG TPA: FAD-dependent oxidoreductase [Phycisphaerales bacterium]|nr:FAD-dependent oxidoreductase [Phycisphaerales bacterium]
MRIAIVGAGISGLACAWYLHRLHDVAVFESQGRVGGHTNTVRVQRRDGETVAVDTGFIVFNDRTYPNFIRLLEELGASARDSSMSFSVRCEKSGLEYNGTTINSLFAQRRNLLNPGFYGMISDILRFGKEAPAVIGAGHARTLGEFLERGRYGRRFREHYILPMAAAIWSAPRDVIMGFPVEFFVRFFKNHGMLTVNDRPVWKTVAGGSYEYVRRMLDVLGSRVRSNAAVTRVERREDHVLVWTRDGVERFDRVILACHSDEALGVLGDASMQEREILGAIRYQANETVLHTDTRLMPRRRLAWAAWNYHICAGDEAPVAVTYNMNILQGLKTAETYLVTLNRADAVDPGKIIQKMVYHHPVFSQGAVRAQARHGEINGARGTHYAGAYWGNGFHEDGVKSAIAACRDLLKAGA